MTVGDLQGHAPTADFLECDFSSLLCSGGLDFMYVIRGRLSTLSCHVWFTSNVLLTPASRT